jgi:Ran GTPase-activating protein (RanGAP) involved in mRNA processing and transport
LALGGRAGAGAPLEALDLADIDMTEGDKQAAAMVLRAKELQFLDLTRTQLGNSGSKMIADVLPHSPSINFLGLAENRIGKKGSIALAEALKWVVPLEELRLCGNDRLDRRVLSKALGGARCCVLSFDW